MAFTLIFARRRHAPELRGLEAATASHPRVADGDLRRGGAREGAGRGARRGERAEARAQAEKARRRRGRAGAGCDRPCCAPRTTLTHLDFLKPAEETPPPPPAYLMVLLLVGPVALGVGRRGWRGGFSRARMRLPCVLQAASENHRHEAKRGAPKRRFSSLGERAYGCAHGTRAWP